MSEGLVAELIGAEQNDHSCPLIRSPMGVAKEQRLVSLVGLLLALTILTISVIEQIQLHRALREAEALGAIIDVSPDQFQMNLRIALALGIGSTCLWSRRANTAAVVIGALLWVFGFLVFLSPDVFDRPEPMVHIAALVFLVLAILCLRRDWSGILNGILSGLFVLINYVLWYMWTQRLKQFTQGGRVYPDTALNNLLADAHGWHVIALGLTICLLVWQSRLLMRLPRRGRSS